MELLKFSSMARRLTSHGSGKQVRMCVLHFTCIPIGIFIQLRQQLGMYFLEDAGRQIGWEKVASLLCMKEAYRPHISSFSSVVE